MTSDPARRLLLLAAPLTVLAAGCGLSRQAPIPFQSTEYAVFGRLFRHGEPAGSQWVKLYDDLEKSVLDSVITDATGLYGFGHVPGVRVMVKVSSTRPDDFRYVRFFVDRKSAADRDSVPPLDLWAYGCTGVSPARGATLPPPDPGRPLEFDWQAMSPTDLIKYKASISDSADSLVWESPREVGGTSALYNGICFGGACQGRLIPPGTYWWRVKVRFPNQVTAATEQWPLELAQPAGKVRS